MAPGAGVRTGVQAHAVAHPVSDSTAPNRPIVATDLRTANARDTATASATQDLGSRMWRASSSAPKGSWGAGSRTRWTGTRWHNEPMEPSEVARQATELSQCQGPLAPYDAVLMAGVRSRRFGRAQSLFDWLDTMAWDGDSVPSSFESVSYGLQRLVHAGLIRIERPRGRSAPLCIRPTETGRDLLKRARHGRGARGGVAARIGSEFAASRSLVEDRSLGPLPDLTADEWNHAYRQWNRVFWARARPWLALSRLMHRYMRWRHRDEFPW
jgi:hypothetical protein